MAITEIASLSTVKQYMRVPNPMSPSQDDSTIQILMGSAQRAIEAELGHIVRKTIRGERHDGGQLEVWLREKPVLAVLNVEEGWGYYNFELDDQEVNSIPALSIWAYSLDDPESGQLTRRAAGNVNVPFVAGKNNIRVEYLAGRTEMPMNAVHAFCELVSIWYRQGQLRFAGGGADEAQYNAQNNDFTKTSGETSINLGVPGAILEMLKSDRHMPFIG